MTPLRNQLPWAVMGPHEYTPGTLLSPWQAQKLFGEAYDPQAQYKACYGAVRRLIGEDEPQRFLVRATPCKNGHHDVILVKPDGSGHYCAGCKREAKRRAVRRKMLADDGPAYGGSGHYRQR